MKKLIALFLLLIACIGGIAFAQFQPITQLPRCPQPNVFSCNYDTIVSLTPCSCVNPTTNAVLSKYVYSNSDITSIENQENAENILVNDIVNAG